MGKRLKNIFST